MRSVAISWCTGNPDSAVQRLPRGGRKARAAAGPCGVGTVCPRMEGDGGEQSHRASPAPPAAALCTVVPALRGSMLSSARPHPAQPAVSHAVTPRLCKLSKKKRMSCWHGCFSPPPTRPSRAHSSRRALQAAADSSATAAMPGMRPPPPRCRAAARERHRLGPTAGTTDLTLGWSRESCRKRRLRAPRAIAGCHSTAQPVPRAQGLHGAQLFPVGGVSALCLLLPCACAAGSPSPSPGSIRHLYGALHRQNRGEHSSLQSPCLSFPFSSPGDALSCTENSWGDAHLPEPQRIQRNTLG